VEERHEARLLAELGLESRLAREASQRRRLGPFEDLDAHDPSVGALGAEDDAEASAAQLVEEVPGAEAHSVALEEGANFGLGVVAGEDIQQEVRLGIALSTRERFLDLERQSHEVVKGGARKLGDVV